MCDFLYEVLTFDTSPLLGFFHCLLIAYSFRGQASLESTMDTNPFGDRSGIYSFNPGDGMPLGIHPRIHWLSNYLSLGLVPEPRNRQP